jgi:hypothetical protein
MNHRRPPHWDAVELPRQIGLVDPRLIEHPELEGTEARSAREPRQAAARVHAVLQPEVVVIECGVISDATNDPFVYVEAAGDERRCAKVVKRFGVRMKAEPPGFRHSRMATRKRIGDETCSTT